MSRRSNARPVPLFWQTWNAAAIARHASGMCVCFAS